MDRKQMIKELQMKFETKAKYLGVPSCAYEITIREKIYTIDRAGRILTATGEVIQLEELLNETIKIENAEVENTTEAAALEESSSENKSAISFSEEALSLEIIRYEIKLPMEGHNANTFRNLINMVYAKQPLIKKALRTGSKILTEQFVYDINQVPMETLEEFRTALEQTENYNEQGIQFDFDEKTLTLKLELNSEKVEAAINLLALVNKTALAQHYASFKVKPTTNEKYTFRTWILRLGMIGDEYKKVRKALLSDLYGNGAFKDKAKAGENNEA